MKTLEIEHTSLRYITRVPPWDRCCDGDCLVVDPLVRSSVLSALVCGTDDAVDGLTLLVLRRLAASLRDSGFDRATVETMVGT